MPTGPGGGRDREDTALYMIRRARELEDRYLAWELLSHYKKDGIVKSACEEYFSAQNFKLHEMIKVAAEHPIIRNSLLSGFSGIRTFRLSAYCRCSSEEEGLRVCDGWYFQNHNRIAYEFTNFTFRHSESGREITFRVDQDKEGNLNLRCRTQEIFSSPVDTLRDISPDFLGWFVEILNESSPRQYTEKELFEMCTGGLREYEGDQ